MVIGAGLIVWAAALFEYDWKLPVSSLILRTVALIVLTSNLSITRLLATDITLVYDTSPENLPSYDPDGSKLALLGTAATQMWESLLPEGGHTYSVGVHYRPFGANATTLGIYNDFDHTISIRNDWNWFLDPTPLDHNEYLPFTQVLARNLSSAEAGSFVGPVPDLLETGYYATAKSDGPASEVSDMYSVLLHEMGHFLAIGYNLLSPDVDLPPQFIGNITGVKAKRENEGHLTPDQSLMDPNLQAGQRVLPSAFDLIVAAHEQSHSFIRPARTDWIGDALSPITTWTWDTGWIGGSHPTSLIDATIRNGATLQINSDVGAKSLTLRVDSGVDLLTNSLLVKEDLSIGGSDYSDVSHLDVHANTVLDAQGNIAVNYGRLQLLGGTAYAEDLHVSQNNIQSLQPRVTGEGQLHVHHTFVNNGLLEASGGLLRVTGDAGVEFDLDGDNEATARSRLKAVDGDLELHRPLADEFASEVFIGGGHSLAFVGPLTFDNASELLFQGTSGVAELRALPSGGTTEIRWHLIVEPDVQARIHADSIAFAETAEVMLGEGSVLSLVGPITYRGGAWNGSGIVHQNGNATVEGDVTISPETYDWDGNLPTPTNTTILPGGRMSIMTSSLGPGGYGGRADVQSNAELNVSVSGPFNTWLIANTGTIRLFQNAHISGGHIIVAGKIEAMEGTSHLESSTTLTANSTLLIHDQATLNIEAPTAYGGGAITTQTETLDDSRLQQFQSALVLGPHSIKTGYFNWDASGNTDSHTVIQEDGILNIQAKEIGNGVTNPLLSFIDREGFGDQIDINSGQLWVNVGYEDRLSSFPERWSLNNGGTMNLNRTTAQLPTVRGSQLVNHGTISGSGQFFNSLENHGVIEVGHLHAVGEIRAMGRLDLASDGILQIELAGLTGGITFDQVATDELTTLAGSLDVSLWNTFVPTPGDLFRIIDGDMDSSVVGTFESMELPYGASAWEVIYGANFVDLRFIAVPEPAAAGLTACTLFVFAMLRRQNRYQ